MLCLSGFELYSRWVPLNLCSDYFHSEFDGGIYWIFFNLTLHDENNYAFKLNILVYFPNNCFKLLENHCLLKAKISVKMISWFRILTRLVVNQLGHEQNLLIVPKTACLTSLILQQYKNGFKDELR